MRLPARFSLLFSIGLTMAGSTALGYYYYWVYSPPLATAEAFMEAMEAGNTGMLEALVRVCATRDCAELRSATPEDVATLLTPQFERGRVLDQRRREGPDRTLHYLVYREPDGRVYALVIAEDGAYDDGAYHVVIPEDSPDARRWYLWDYTWTN